MKQILLVVLSLIMIFSFAACGENEEVQNAADKVQDALKATDASGNLDKDAINDALDDYNDALDNAGGEVNKGMTVEEYVDLAKDAVSQQSNDTFDVSFSARGNSVVYTYKYKIPVADNAKDLLDSSMNEAKDTYATLKGTIQKECKAVEKIIYEYYDINNNLIASYEY